MSPPADRIELLAAPAAPTLAAHLIRNAKESGRDGEPYSRARSADDLPHLERTVARLVGAWAIPVGTPGWEICFGLWVDGDLHGHLDLRGGAVTTELHRAELGMGIERPYRRKGWGQRMIETAIGWGRDHGLAWLDLGVFTDNLPAHALYVRNGFVEVGVSHDRFRIDGQSIDDRIMVLKL